MSKETASSSSEEDQKKELQIATDQEVQEAAEEAAIKIADIIQKHEATTVLSKYGVGKAIWDVLTKRKDKNYLGGGDQLFAEVAKRVVEKTGADINQLAPRTLRYYASMAKVVTKKEIERLAKLPKFAYSKLKAVFDLFGLGKALRDGDAKEQKAKAIEFLEKNLELNTHQLRQVYDDTMRPPPPDGGAGTSGSGSGGGGGSLGGGGGGGGSGGSRPTNIHSIPQKIPGSIDGLMTACGDITILLKDGDGPKFKTEGKRNNFVQRLHEARAALVQVADTAEATINEIDTWEAKKFAKSVEKKGKPESSSEDKPKDDKKPKKGKKNKKKDETPRKPLGKDQPPADTVADAMDKAKEARENAKKRHKGDTPPETDEE